MAAEVITHTRKDKHGDITHLRNSEGRRYEVKDMISQIKLGYIQFYVIVNGARAEIRVVGPYGREYLRTTADTGNFNILDNLPDC